MTSDDAAMEKELIFLVPTKERANLWLGRGWWKQRVVIMCCSRDCVMYRDLLMAVLSTIIYTSDGLKKTWCHDSAGPAHTQESTACVAARTAINRA